MVFKGVFFIIWVMGTYFLKHGDSILSIIVPIILLFDHHPLIGISHIHGNQ